jgi:hypothetical protein
MVSMMLPRFFLFFFGAVTDSSANANALAEVSVTAGNA